MRTNTVLLIVLLVAVVAIDVFSFPAIKRDHRTDWFPGENGDKRSMINNKYNWETDKDLPFPNRPPWTTHGEKRTAINNKHEWGDNDFPFPNRPPWTTHGEKRTAINNKHEWGDKDFPFPNRPPWTTHGEKRSAINYKNEWKENNQFPAPRPWSTPGENMQDSREMKKKQVQDLLDVLEG